MVGLTEVEAEREFRRSFRFAIFALSDSFTFSAILVMVAFRPPFLSGLVLSRSGDSASAAASSFTCGTERQTQ